MSVGSRIKDARKHNDLTQKELAEAIGVTKGAIANYENGISIPKIELMYKIMNALDVDANYIYQDEMASFVPEIKTPAPALSEDEQDFMDVYRGLSREQQCELKGYAKRMKHEAEAAEAAKQIKDA